MPFSCIRLSQLTFCKSFVLPMVTLLANAKLLQTLMHFGLRLCFLVVVPFNLRCKLQLSTLKGTLKRSKFTYLSPVIMNILYCWLLDSCRIMGRRLWR